MGGIVALVVLVALAGFALSRVARSWRTTTRVWSEDDPEADGEGETR
jgi:hypothetical protein